MDVKQNLETLRNDFPILKEMHHDKLNAYLDNAASTQKPQAVIDAIVQCYEHEYANVHRGVHLLSAKATKAYEDSRVKTQKFINAASEKEIIFTRGTTESINLVAQTFGRANIGAGDEVVISAMEHHSNIVPWQMLCEQTGAKLVVAPIDKAGNLLLDEFAHCLTTKTKLVSIVHVSNALGTINPVEQIIELAHARKIPVMLDGAQAVPHFAVDVQALDCDFFAFSGHKMFAPSGIGVLYAKKDLLESMPPYQGGGDMIRTVSFDKTTYNELPYKFEAGTPNIAGAIGLGAAVDYLTAIGMDNIQKYEDELMDYALHQLREIPDVHLVGESAQRAGSISFVLDGVHAHDIGTILDSEAVAVRTGHHCAMPVMTFFGIAATVRASLAFYNTFEEVDRLVDALNKVREVFA